MPHCIYLHISIHPIRLHREIRSHSLCHVVHQVGFDLIEEGNMAVNVELLVRRYSYTTRRRVQVQIYTEVEDILHDYLCVGKPRWRAIHESRA